MNEKKKVYHLADLVKRLDRNKTTLLRWEAEGKIPKARRDSRGWRYYTPEDFILTVRTVEKNLYFHNGQPREGRGSTAVILSDSEGSREDASASPQHSDSPKLGALAIKPPRSRIASSGWTWRFWSLFMSVAFILVMPYLAAAGFPSVVSLQRAAVNFNINLPDLNIAIKEPSRYFTPKRDPVLASVFRAVFTRSNLVKSPSPPALPLSAGLGIEFKVPEAYDRFLSDANERAGELAQGMKLDISPAARTFSPVHDAVLAKAAAELKIPNHLLTSSFLLLPSYFTSASDRLVASLESLPPIVMPSSQLAAANPLEAIKSFLGGLLTSEQEPVSSEQPPVGQTPITKEQTPNNAQAPITNIQTGERVIIREIIRETPALVPEPVEGLPKIITGIESRLSKTITDIANLYTLLDSKTNYAAFAPS